MLSVKCPHPRLIKRARNRVRWLLASAFMIGASYTIAKYEWRSEPQSYTQVQNRWGSEPFDIVKFKEGGYKIRAKMAAALMKSKEFLGKDPTEIRAQLGDWDGYYFTDTYPAYIIQSRREGSDETWQIVFLLNRRYKTTEIIVNKNR